MNDDRHRLMVATDLLQQCAEGFGAFIHGRKMARKERDTLRRQIADFLDGAAPRMTPRATLNAPAAQYGQCHTCGEYSSAAKALHDAQDRCR